MAIDAAARPLGVAATPVETRRPVIVHLAQRAEALGYTLAAFAPG
jgi:hypothetical protein